MRLAALEALGGAGDAAAVATLVEAAATGGDAQRVAQASLVRVPGPDIDQKMLAMVDQAYRTSSHRSHRCARRPSCRGSCAAAAEDSRRPATHSASGSHPRPGFARDTSDLAALLKLVVDPNPLRIDLHDRCGRESAFPRRGQGQVGRADPSTCSPMRLLKRLNRRCC